MRGYELRRDPHAPFRAQNGSRHDAIDPQLARDLRNGFVRTLVRQDGSPRRHPQGTDMPQTRDQRVGHPVREVFLRGIIREVLHRQHG